MNGELNLDFDFDNGKFILKYWEHEFPIKLSTYAIILKYRINSLKKLLNENLSDFKEYLNLTNKLSCAKLSGLCAKNKIISEFIS